MIYQFILDFIVSGSLMKRFTLVMISITWTQFESEIKILYTHIYRDACIFIPHHLH